MGGRSPPYQKQRLLVQACLRLGSQLYDLGPDSGLLWSPENELLQELPQRVAVKTKHTMAYNVFEKCLTLGVCSLVLAITIHPGARAASCWEPVLLGFAMACVRAWGIPGVRNVSELGARGWG
jgi:hypothetical protein